MDFSKYIERQGQVSQGYSLLKYFARQNILYSMIPKNACTSIFTAFVREECELFDWFLKKNRIHNLQKNFWPFADRSSLTGIKTTAHKIIAFREPTERLYSAIIDKLILNKLAQGNFSGGFEARIKKPISECKLLEIIGILDSTPGVALNQHFAPQIDFVFFKRYDTVLLLNEPLHSLEINGRAYKIGTDNQTKKWSEHEEVSAETTLGTLMKRAVKSAELPSRSLFTELLRANSEPGGNLELDLQLWRELGG